MKNIISGERDATTEVQSSVKRIMENLSPHTVENLASKNIKERRRSIALLSSAIGDYPNQIPDIIQVLPIELLGENKVSEAIGYMIEEGRKGVCFSPEVIRTVLESAYETKERYETIDPRTESKILEIEFLQKMLKQMLFAQFDMDEGTIELSAMIGDYYALFEELPDLAQSYYSRGAGLGDMTAILRSGTYYMDRGESKIALSLLDSGWAQSKNAMFIEKSIEACFFSGDTVEAANRYTSLMENFPTHSLPILAYKGHIETDTDLEEFEIIMDGFYLNPCPTKVHEKLVISAKEYMNARIDELLETIQSIASDTSSNSCLQELVLRRLAYMEKHIFLLLDDTYLEVYLDEIRYCLAGSVHLQSMLATYFETHPLPMVQSQIRFDDLDTNDRRQESCLSNPGDLHEIIIQRLTYLSCRFFESGKENLFHTISDLGEKYFPDYPSMQTTAHNIALDIGKEKKHMEEMSSDISVIYQHIIRSLDLKYGTYFRRHVQYIARHSYRTKEECPEILRAIPRAGMYFLVESIVSHSAGKKDVLGLIESFSLNLLPLTDALILANVLIHNGFEREGIMYLSGLEGAFLETEFLELIIEGVFHLEESNMSREILGHLDIICQERYNETSFFTLIHKTVQSISADAYACVGGKNSLDIATGHIHMFHGQQKKALKKFARAARNDSIEGYIQCARVLEFSLDRPEDALDMYILAYSLGQKYKSTEILQSIVNLCTRLDKPTLRNRYIQIALQEKSLDSADLFAMDIYGNDEQKYRALRSMALNSGEIWANDSEQVLLEKYIDDSLTNEVLTTDMDIKKFLLSSYMKSLESDSSGSAIPGNILEHWKNMGSLVFNFKKSALASLSPHFQEFIDIPENTTDRLEQNGEIKEEILQDIVYMEPYENPFQELATLIHVHAFDSSVAIGKLIKESHKQGDNKKGMKHLCDYVHMAGLVIALLRCIPGTEPYTKRWQVELDATQNIIYRASAKDRLSYTSPGNHTFLH